MMVDSEFLGIYSGWRHWHERVQVGVWWIQTRQSKLLAHVLWCGGACLLCLHFFIRWKISCSLCVNLEVHIFDPGIKWLLFFHCKAVMSIRDAVTVTKSYNKPCMLIVYPGFWILLSNDMDLGTAFNCPCCFCWLSIHVGSHFICR